MKITKPAHNFDVTVIELKNALENQEDFTLLDVRRPDEYANAHVGGTDLLIPEEDVMDNIDSLPTDKEQFIYCICRTGRRSGIIVDALRRLGYKNTYNVSGGIVTWAGAGFEIESGERE